MRRGGVGFAIVVLAALGGCGGDAPPEVRVAPRLLPPEDGVLRLCGTGAMLPIVRALGAAFQADPARSAGLRVVVEESVGSGGGLRATADGAIDVGLVSRALSAAEAQLGLTVVEVATDAVIIAAQPDVPIEGLTTAELLALYGGRTRHFPDGSPATVLLRDRGESANFALDAALPGMNEARERSYRLGFRVIYHDDEMAAALALTPGSIGVYSFGLLRATRIPLKVLALDGKRPSVEALADGSWRVTRPLAFVVRPERLARVAPLLQLAASDEGRRLIREAGYLPVSPGAR